MGKAALQATTGTVTGTFVELEGETFYRIGRYDRMAPFLTSVVSDGDHWLFASSNGGLTAGRRSPDEALFPYCTDDKIHDAHDLTGSKTLILAKQPERTSLWEPFSNRYGGLYSIERNLYKHVYGDKLRYEEVNHDLELTFSYTWCTSERFGFVKRSELRSHAAGAMEVRVLDGMQNVLPHGVSSAMQTSRSTLVDAYKKSELYVPSGLALFLLSSIPVDKPEPSESLMATTVWSTGLEAEEILLSTNQLDRFREGRCVEQENDVRGERGAYFVRASFEQAPGECRTWYVVADVGQGPDDVVALEVLLNAEPDVGTLIERDVRAGTERLVRLVAGADGMQCTADPMVAAKHFSNVLFNVMRGGVFVRNGGVGRAVLAAFLQRRNRGTADRHTAWLEALPDETPIHVLLTEAARSGDPQLERLCHEYLPLAFGRRHGDPSRPWNRFTIDTQNEDGSPKFAYEGNWRDIFQNWEALGLSYPGYVENMICTFVNASTADGYNPYRLTHEGIDWEVIDPGDPWSHIGYWGDHQVIYLLKLLEISRAHHPGRLRDLLTRRIFAYADVPYRIRSYREMLLDPHDTIDFDEASAGRVDERVAAIGADGKLIPDDAGAVYLVNLAEKLLVALLAKLSNFIPGGGIWMNTQRPEWNDANNALVGYGVSMVTLCYLRRYLHFVSGLFAGLPDDAVELSEEVAGFLDATGEALDRYEHLLRGDVTAADRRRVLDALGHAGSAYRMRIYRGGFSGSTRLVHRDAILAFFDRGLAFADHTIRSNRRDDGLFHAYSLMSIEEDGGIALRPMYAMLEGQVAVLSAGMLSGAEALEVLSALASSPLFRPDQNTYLLYPDRRLPRFVEKNRIKAGRVERSTLLRSLAADGDRRLLVRDGKGTYHFNGAFRNKDSVRATLEALRQAGYEEEVERDEALVLDLFEEVFDHRSYTGRSGTFFAYEGLGSIYWHMVSKLLLAVGECVFACGHTAVQSGTSAGSSAAPPPVATPPPAGLEGKVGEDEAGVREALTERYYEIQAGLGMNKRPDEFGAFPSDPYSHTPGHRGAQQPGMTGQVKEDVICRWGELGVTVQDGRIRFRSTLLRRPEFLATPAVFRYYGVDGEAHRLELEPGTLAFTYCQVPIVYRLASPARILLKRRDGSEDVLDGLALGRDASASVFRREGTIRAIEVELAPASVTA